MSKMSDISLEIQELLGEGVRPTKVAKLLKVPLAWVYDTLEMIESEYADSDCYAQEANSRYR
jgi:hypothetical protein